MKRREDFFEARKHCIIFFFTSIIQNNISNMPMFLILMLLEISQVIKYSYYSFSDNITNYAILNYLINFCDILPLLRFFKNEILYLVFIFALAIFQMLMFLYMLRARLGILLDNKVLWKITSFILLLYQRLLFAPTVFLAIFCFRFENTSHILYENANLSNIYGILFIIAGVTLLLVSISFNTLVALYFNDSRMISTIPWNSPQSSVEILIIIAKAFLAFGANFSNFLRNSPWKLVFLIFTLIIGIILALQYILSYSYHYHWVISIFYMLLISSLISFPFVGLVTISLNSACLTYYIFGGVLCLALMALLGFIRALAIIKLSDFDMKSVKDENKSIFLLSQLFSKMEIDLAKEQEVDFLFTVSIPLAIHLINNNENLEDIVDRSFSRNNKKGINHIQRSIAFWNNYEAVAEFLLSRSKNKFPFKSIISEINSEKKLNYGKSLWIIEHSRKKRRNFNKMMKANINMFDLEHKIIKNATLVSKLDTNSYFYFDKGIKKFSKTMKDYADKSMETFSLLLMPSFDPNVFYKHVLQLSTSNSHIYSKFDKLYKECPNNMNLLISFARFLQLVLQSSGEAQDYINKCLDLKKKIKVYSGVSSLDQEYGLSSEGSCCIISGNKNDLGVILHTSHSFCNILGYNNDELKGVNISQVIPHYIGKDHNKFLTNHILNSSNICNDNENFQFALTKKNHIIPIKIFMNLLPQLLEGVKFIGIIRKIKKDTSILKVPSEFSGFKFCIFLTKTTGDIFAFNNRAFKLFINFSNKQTLLELLNNNNINISVMNSILIDKEKYNMLERGTTLKLNISHLKSKINEDYFSIEDATSANIESEVYLRLIVVQNIHISYLVYLIIPLFAGTEKLNKQQKIIVSDASENELVNVKSQIKTKIMKKNKGKIEQVDIAEMESQSSVSSSSSFHSNELLNTFTNFKRDLNNIPLPFMLTFLNLFVSVMLICLAILNLTDFIITKQLYDDTKSGINLLLYNINKTSSMFSLTIDIHNYISIANNQKIVDDANQEALFESLKIKIPNEIEDFSNLLLNMDNINSQFNLVPESKVWNINAVSISSKVSYYNYSQSFEIAEYNFLYNLISIMSTEKIDLITKHCYIIIIQPCEDTSITIRDLDKNMIYIFENIKKDLSYYSEKFSSVLIDKLTEKVLGNINLMLTFASVCSGFVVLSLISIIPILISVAKSKVQALTIFSLLNITAIKNLSSNIREYLTSQKSIQNSNKFRNSEKINLSMSINDKESRIQNNNNFYEENKESKDQDDILNDKNSTELSKLIPAKKVGHGEELRKINTATKKLLLIIFSIGIIYILIFWIFFILKYFQMSQTKNSFVVIKNVNSLGSLIFKAYYALKITVLFDDVVKTDQSSNLFLDTLNETYLNVEKDYSFIADPSDILKPLADFLIEMEKPGKACQAIKENSNFDCSGIDNIVFKEGLLHVYSLVLKYFSITYQNFEAYVNNSITDMNIVGKLLLTPIILDSSNIVNNYLVPLVSITMANTQSSIYSFFNQIQNQEQIKCGCFITSVALILILFWPILMHSIRKDVRNSRKIINLLGIDMIEKNDELLKELKKIIT